MQIISYDQNLYFFLWRIHNLRDYSIYKVTINVFFASNLKISRILRSMIQSFDLRSYLPPVILRRISILTTLHPTTNTDHPPLDVFISTSILSLPPLDQTTVSKSPPPSHYSHPTHPWTDLSFSRSTSLSLPLSQSIWFESLIFCIFFFSLDFYIRNF